MCGNFGIIFDNIPEPKHGAIYSRLFSMLAVLSAERGLHSTGLARVNINGTGSVYKDIVPSYDIVRRPAWYNELAAVNKDTLMLMGHTRHGTHGKNLIENAHPHYYRTERGTLIGTHNGVITNHSALAPGDKPLENDSANLFWRLSVEEPANWIKILELLYGSYALIWTENSKIHIARNWGSPLFIGTIKSLGATVYASTAHILKAAGAIAGVKLDSCTSVDAGTLFTYDNGLKSETKFGLSQDDYGFYSNYGNHYTPSTTISSVHQKIDVDSSMFANGKMQTCVVCGKHKYMSYSNKYINEKVCDDCVEEWDSINRHKPKISISKYCYGCNQWSMFDIKRIDYQKDTICNTCRFNERFIEPRLLTAGGD